MPRPCSICSHSDREAIAAALTQATPLRIVSACFEISPAALRRHQQRHMQPHAAVVPLVDAAKRVHVSAGLVQRQTTALRSVYEDLLVQRLEGLATVLVEVTSLLVALTTAPRR